MKNIQDITNRIYELLENVNGSNYFTVYSNDGKEIKIRVSNHSANHNNNGNIKTLSFVSEKTEQRKSDLNKMVCEWEVSEKYDGYTDTYQDIEEVLEWEDVADDQEKAKELYQAKITEEIENYINQ